MKLNQLQTVRVGHVIKRKQMILMSLGLRLS